MPQTVNGIGTGYSGKTNISYRRGRCESCGRYGDLRSYDTGLYFLFFFIPLVPLGKRRVIDQCPHCRVHRVANLKEWEHRKNTEVERVLRELNDDPDDPHSAIEAVGVVAAFQDYKAFERIAPSIVQVQSGSVEVLLAVASAHESFGRPGEAEALYRRCLEINDSEEVREALAVNLIRQLRPAEASAYLEHAIRGSDSEKVGLLWLLMEAWQAEGEHEKALELIDQCAARAPELKSNKGFQKAERLSKKHLHSGKKIRSERLGAARKSFDEGRKTSRLVAKLAGPVLFVVVLALYLHICIDAGRHRKVWLVNGLERPYQVEVGGTKVGLAPSRAVSVKVREGTIPVRVLDDALSIPDQSVNIRTPFFIRPFLDRTYVINPDQIAFIAREEHLYFPEDKTPSEGSIPDPRYDLFVNRTLYEFRDIDFPFETAPNRLRSEHKGLVRKFDLHVESGLPSYMRLAALESVAGKDVAVESAKKRLAISHTDQNALYYLSARLEPKEVLAFLRPGLAARPVRVDWHRMYQETVGKARPEHDLVAEYKALLDKEPESRELAYLTGRAMLDPDAAREYLLRSVQEPGPSHYGYGALAFLHSACGKFSEALKYYNKALELAPGNEQYLARRMQCHLGMGNYGKALKWAQDQRRRSPDIPTFLEYVILLDVANGDIKQAEKEIDLLLQKVERETHASQQEERKTIRDYYTALVEYGKGNVDPVMDLWSKEPSDLRGLIALLGRERFEEAGKLLDEEDLHDVQNEFLVYLAADRAGKSELAAGHFDQGVKRLEEGGNEERYLADVLTGNEPVDPAFIAKLAIDLEEKAILLAVLGARFPEHRPAMISLARKLNCDVTPPRRFLDHILDQTH